MVVEVLRYEEIGAWQVTLARTNFRPQRRYVEVGPVESSSEGDDRERIVGYSDDPAEADRLFEAALRTVTVLVNGGCEAVEMFNRADGLPE